MSFAIWNSAPPFDKTTNPAEKIYQVGKVWVVTDDPSRATQAEVDAVLTAARTPPTAAQKLQQMGITAADLRALIQP